MLFALQQRFALFSVGPTGEDFLETFHHMLNDMKVIDHDLRLGKTKLHGWTKRSTHIHAHDLHRIGIAKPFQQSGIWLGKTFLTGEASKASLVENELHLILSQSYIALLSCSSIMDLHTHFLTIRADRLGCRSDHLDSKHPILLPFLLQNVQFRQAQWHDYSFSPENFFCGMMAW